MAQLSSYDQNGLEYIVIENSSLKTVWLPAIGGKLVSLIDKASGAQLLGQPARVFTKENLPCYGSPYEDFYGGGFDECFPTINESEYTLPEDSAGRRQIRFPDHGEVWSLPWEKYTRSDGLSMKIDGVRRSYELQKNIQMMQRTIELHYTLTNYGDMPLDYLWAGNTILRLSKDDTIRLEPLSKKVFLEKFGKAGYSLPGKIVDWSEITEHPGSKLNEISVREIRDPLRFYTDRISTGVCAVYFMQYDVTLSLQVNPEVNPYLGIDVQTRNQNESGETFRTVSLFTSTGRPGSLAEAVQRQENGHIESHEMKEWTVKIDVS